MSKRYPAVYPWSDKPETVADIDLPEDGHIHLADAVQDNISRAGSAAVALKAFAKTQGMDQADGTNGYLHSESPATAMCDLLCNLRHLCDALGLEFVSVDTDAAMAYEAELTAEDYGL